MRKLLLLAPVVVALALGVGAGRSGHGAAAPPGSGIPPDAQSATITRNVDGDTVWLVGSGRGPVRSGTETKVRILEIDTPEVFGHVECFGEEASAFARRTLPVGSRVWVARDKDLHDRYGRTLLYVWTSSRAFYEDLAVRAGYARTALYVPNDRYIAHLRALEQDARSAGTGLWSRC